MRRSAALRSLSPTALKGAVIVLAAALALVALASLPFLWRASLQSSAEAQKAELDLVRAKVLAQVKMRGPRLTAADDVAQMFLPGATAGTALAAFQSLVSTAADESGMSVLRMQPLPTDEESGLSPFRLSVDLSGSLDQLTALLAGLESGLPLVTVAGLEVQPRGDANASQPYASEDIAVSLKLEAFSWRGAQ